MVQAATADEQANVKKYGKLLQETIGISVDFSKTLAAVNAGVAPAEDASMHIDALTERWLSNMNSMAQLVQSMSDKELMMVVQVLENPDVSQELKKVEAALLVLRAELKAKNYFGSDELRIACEKFFVVRGAL